MPAIFFIFCMKPSFLGVGRNNPYLTRTMHPVLFSNGTCNYIDPIFHIHWFLKTGFQSKSSNWPKPHNMIFVWCKRHRLSHTNSILEVAFFGQHGLRNEIRFDWGQFIIHETEQQQEEASWTEGLVGIILGPLVNRQNIRLPN